MENSEMKTEFSQKITKATKEESLFVTFVCFCFDPQSATPFPKSAIRNPQSAM